MFPNQILSQEVTIQPSTVKLNDTLKYDEKTKGIFKKMVQAFKFKDNRNKKEKERIYLFLMELIKKGQLNIDSTTVNNIKVQLDSINKYNLRLNAKDTIFSNKIDSIIKVYDYDKIISKDAVDSLKIKLDSILKVISLKVKVDTLTRAQKDSLKIILRDLRGIRFTEKNKNLAPWDSILGDDSTYIRFKKYIAHKKEIIGWHNAWNKTEYKNYNYNYLTAINLYGYELAPNGKIKNPIDIERFTKQEGVIDFAQSQLADVYLTIYNKYPIEISSFLNNSHAQQVFLTDLERLIKNYDLKGINLYFENVSTKDNQNFVAFAFSLHEILEKFEDVKLTITIPSVWNDSSLENISAYDFTKLNAIVDYYLVSTDKMTKLNNTISLPFSPLFSGGRSGQNSIESTINFYLNGKIPISKIIMSVSYSGIDWNVKNFKGEVLERTIGEELKYNDILEKYINTYDPKNSFKVEFDTIQIVSYLNISKQDSPWYGNTEYRQVWFESNKSLKLKYKWLLDNNLAGVSIRGLGYDDGYANLWDAIGTELIKVETDSISDKEVNGIEECKYDKAKDKFNIFNKEQRSRVWQNFQAFNIEKDSLVFFDVFMQDNIWAIQPDLEYKTKDNVLHFSKDGEKRIKLLNNEKTCRCLMGRWYLYSTLFFIFTSICLFILILLRLWVNYLDRFNKGTDKLRFFITIGSYLFFIIGLISFLAAIFLAPWIDSIGASNQGNTGYEVLIFPAVIGLVIGIIINQGRIRRKYVPRDLP
ncbi:hypothetical protein LPB138_08440 [Urechidicola croceus]|uniref:chitinase n=1 Tax=Urechidicola croceus TaxID=1850246 RepID=A0A1D8P834_9FLAO|nr:hypothetical protein LPB138_08440 [Urechidicola croceus]